MRRVILVFMLCVSVLPVLVAQQKERIHTLKNVRGEFAMVVMRSDITGREATEKAREDAKRKAIEQVCGSRMSIWDKVEMSSVGESFNSMTINQVDGEIVSFEIVEEGTKQSVIRPEEMIFYCVANVQVKQGIVPDPNFTAAIEGLRSLYFEGETIKFSVLPYRDCYLKIFLFEDAHTGYLLYPNDYDLPELLRANRKIAFPQNVEFVTTKKPENQTEINRMVFVFTKDERPFYHSVTSRQEIEQWMAMIPNDEKYIVFSVLEIR